MPSNSSKYADEIREQTARYILENGKSVMSVAEEMGIDTNTVCMWVRDYGKLSCKHEDGVFLSEGVCCNRQCQERSILFIEIIYNRKRLHSSLGYMSPGSYRLKNHGGTVA